MPVTPAQARLRREASHRSKLDDVCCRIDRMLMEDKPNDRGQWWFGVAGLGLDTRAKLLVIYRAHNWLVEIVDDPRDSVALVFEEHPRSLGGAQ